MHAIEAELQTVRRQINLLNKAQLRLLDEYAVARQRPIDQAFKPPAESELSHALRRHALVRRLLDARPSLRTLSPVSMARVILLVISLERGGSPSWVGGSLLVGSSRMRRTRLQGGTWSSCGLLATAKRSSPRRLPGISAG